MSSLIDTAAGRSLGQVDAGSVPFGVSELGDPTIRAGLFLIGFAIVLLVGWFVLEPAISRVIEGRNRNNPTLEEAISRYVRLLVAVCAIFVGLGAAGFTGVVGNSALVVAAATLAIGVAGGSVIGSLVSGIALVVDPQFNVGNYIRWSDGEGEVSSITLRVTRVQTLEGGLVTVPNTTLTEESIARPFEGGSCRTRDRVTISYDDDVDDALRLLAEIAGDLDGVLADPAPRVGVDELGDDGIVLSVEYWIVDPRRNLLPVRSALGRAVVERFDRAGFDLSPSSKRELEGRVRVDTGA